MSWKIARADVACSFCPVTITAGEPARFGDLAQGVVWCQACAKSGLREDPPASLTVAPEVLVQEPEPEPQASLFDEPIGRRFKSFDARHALDEFRKVLPGANRGGAA